MTVPQFKTRVASFITRAESDFVNGANDELLNAINDARRLAQRRYTFLRLRDDGFLTTSILGADYTANTKATPGGATVKVKLIEKVWEYQTRAISAGNLYERTAQVDYRTDRNLGEGLPYSGTGVSTTNSLNRLTSTYTGRTIGWSKGTKLFVNVETATDYLVEYVQWLDNLVGNEGSDFFITYAEDWLLWQTLECLNGYLKEDQRIQISQRKLNDCWETFTQWDSDVMNSNDSRDLE